MKLGGVNLKEVGTQRHEYDQNTLYEVLEELIKYNLKNNRRNFSVSKYAMII